MAYCGYVTTLKNIRPHSNANRMKLADCFGNTICVGIDAAEGDIGVYFPVDGQLSVEYCVQNDLVRRKDENGNPAGGYLDPEKRNIRAIKLRGEKSDGLFMPLSSFIYTGINPNELVIGTPVPVVRCCECKFGVTPYGNEHDGWIECSNIHSRPLFGCNDFCSYGERKEGAD